MKLTVRKHKSSFSTVIPIVLFLFLGLTLVPVFSTPLQSSAQSSSSCPAGSILHLTMYGGAPSNFNILGAYNPGGFFASYMQYPSGAAPIVTPQGQVQNYSTAAQSIDHNSNYTQWTIHIKQGLTWSNGQPVTSQDYLSEWSPNFALNPAFDAIGVSAEITKVSAPNTTTVQFNLNATDAHFDEKISQVLETVLFPKSFTSMGASFNGFGTSVGFGPFYVVNYTAGQTQMIMLRNPNYKPLPQVCEIIWNFVESESQDSIYIASGASDLAPVVTGSISSLTSANPNIHILQQPDVLITYMSYNVSSYPYNMTEFRQALAYGINQSNISQQAFNGFGTNAYNAEGSIPTDSKLYNSNQAKYSYDPAKAAALLNSIGFKKGSDGILRYPNGTSISLTLWADSDAASNSIAAGFVKSDLQALGFNINLQLASTSTIIGYNFANNYDIQHQMIMHTSNAMYAGDAFYMAQQAPLTWELPGPTAPAYMSPPNINAEYMSNVSALTATSDPTLDSQYMSNIQSLFASSLPVLPLTYSGFTFAYSTAHFTNWPSGYLYPGYIWNYTGLADLKPVSSGVTTSQQSSSTGGSSSQSSATQTGSSPTQTNTGVGPTATTTAFVTLTSSVTGQSNNNNTLLYAAIAVVIIVIIVAAVAFMRRR